MGHARLGELGRAKRRHALVRRLDLRWKNCLRAPARELCSVTDPVAQLVEQRTLDSSQRLGDD
jgi:hypothetical protein